MAAEHGRIGQYDEEEVPEKGGAPMSVRPAERAGQRRQFMKMAGEAFDAIFDDDEQEQLITMTQREDLEETRCSRRRGRIRI